MKHAKKILAALLAGLLTFSACACSPSEALSSDDVQGSGGNPQAEPQGYALQRHEKADVPAFPDEEEYLESGDWDAYNAAYDAWFAFDAARREAAYSYEGLLNAYVRKALPVFLQPADPAENAVCSPVNIWLALAMLAETTEGETRKELTDLLGISDMQQLRETAANVFTANYTDDGSATSLPSASIWMNREVQYKEDLLKILAEYYAADSFRGDMSDKAYSAAFKDWLKAATGGLLDESVDKLPDFDQETVLALATAIYFKAAWAENFQEAATRAQTFHGAKGDQEFDFMHQTERMSYFRGDNFAAIGKRMTNAGTMWFVLPDEGVTPAELVNSGAAADFLEDPYRFTAGSYEVTLAMPKFDVNADLDLKEVLPKLGVERIFDDRADFSPLTDTQDLEVSSASHSARVKVDEDGVEAAAFTVFLVEATAALEPQRIDFILDRPFLFAVTGVDGLPLFCGVVNSL